MPYLIFVRHGENDYVKTNRLAGRLSGIHLNDTGIQQANSVAEMLRTFPIKAVYSSPLERTMETAIPIANALNLQVTPRAGLIEMDYGEWQDKKLKGLSRLKLWKVVQARPSRMRFPSGESFFEANFRVNHEVERLVANHDEKDMVVCVSHSDIIKLIVANFLGLSLDMFQRIQISPGSLTVLNIQKYSSQLIYLNYERSIKLPLK